MLELVLWAIIVALASIAMLLFSVAKRATREAVYLSSFTALMCIERDVYMNNAPKFNSWILENIDNVNIDTKSASSINKASTRFAVSFLDQLGGPAVPLMACISELKRSSKA